MSIKPNQNTINIILGSTSAGKTALALKLCKKYNGAIISADSRQIYKYMDIGTGKVPTQNLEGEQKVAKTKKTSKITKSDKKWTIDTIDIWGYDLAEPDEYFSAFDFSTFARRKISELQSLGKNVFVVGGTGFYIDLLTGDREVESVGRDEDLRHELEQKSLAELVVALTSLNLRVVKKIDNQNKSRLIRAIEKETLKNSQKNKPQELPPIPANTTFAYFGLTADRSTLYNRADNWLDAIWHNGLLTETEFLLKKYPNTPKLQGLIYKSAVAQLTGEHPQEVAIQRAKFDLHAYIRRQQTWFKKNAKISWVDITQPDKQKIDQNVQKSIENQKNLENLLK